MRLNNALRSSIKSTLLSEAFDARQTALDEAEHELAAEVHAGLYTTKIRELIKQLPGDFLPTVNEMFVRIEGEGEVRVELKSPLPVSEADSKYRKIHHVYPANHPFSRRYGKWAEAKNQFRRERKEAQSGADAILNSVSTIKKLREVWPEVSPIIDIVLNRGPAAMSLPAAPTKELNKLLNLGGSK